MLTSSRREREREGLLGRGSPELVVAVGAAETADVKHLLVGQEPLHGVHGLLALHAALARWCLELLEKEANGSASAVSMGPSAAGLGLTHLWAELLGTTPARAMAGLTGQGGSPVFLYQTV